MHGMNWRTALLGGASLLVLAAPGAGAQTLDAASGAQGGAAADDAPIVVADAAAAQAAAPPDRRKASAPAATDEEGEVEEIIVRGFRPSIERAIDLKRRSTSIIEAISAEDIGKLPDVSIGETLARLPGLTAQRLDGRAQSISIRGLGPDFSTALLNGREQVTTSDNRGIEFDQYPAELLGGVVVYKTPDATLIGQGLAGTVDLRTIRPLEHGRRSFTVNARGEFNEDGSLNPDAPSKGFRASATYIDQFADDTLGVTLGFAAQSTPTQSERFNAWGWPTTDGAFVIGGSKPFAQSNDLDRVAVIGTLEYEPSDSFRTTLDLSYSDFEETRRLRGIEFPLFWSAAQLRPGFTVENGLVVNGVFDDVKAVVRNDRDDRSAQLFTAGWNAQVDLSDDWTFESDLSYSRSRRNDSLLETLSGTGPAGTGATDALGFDIQPNGVVKFSPTLDYADSNLLRLTDPQGWGSFFGLTQAGFLNKPRTRDELTHLRFSVERELHDSAFSGIVAGVDLSQRNKNKRVDERFLTPPGGATDVAIPAAALLDKSVSLDFIGIPGMIALDPLFLLDNVLDSVPNTRADVVTKQWKVRENVLVGYVMGKIDTQWGAVPVTGNIGTQIVFTDQSSTGFGIRPPTGGDPSGGPFVEAREGDQYTKILPSLNLIFDFGNDTLLRFGAARTLARARMDQLNASQQFGTDVTRLTSTDPNQSFFSSSGGNPRLRPTISNQIDLSLEKYFADGAGYFAVAGFYKDLQDFINPNDSVIFDFADFVDFAVPPDLRGQLGTTLGLVSGPSNRGRGNIRGVEATLSLPAEVLSPALLGFGVIVSGSYTDSKVLLGDSTEPTTVPGLSKWVVNTTVYYEKNGFQTRLSHRYRTKFLGEVAGFGAGRTLRSVRGESVLDAQLSYSFESGPFKGITILAQANNLTDEPFVTIQEPDRRLVIDHQSFGRTYLFGASYSF